MSEPLLLLDYSTPPTLRPARPLALAGIAVTAVLAGTVIGASTGVIDGTLCPEYFTNALGPRGDTVWQASMLRGAVAGSILGSFLSAFATAIISIITQASCTFKAGLRWLGFVMLGVYGMWMFGGATAVGLAALTPRVCQNLDQRIFRAAWVDGSIWGAEFGGCVVVLIGLGLFDMRWQRMMKLESRR